MQINPAGSFTPVDITCMCFACGTLFISNVYRLLRQILNEILRLALLSTFTARYSDEDIVIRDYCIPAGTPMVIALGVSLKNETVWKHTEK